MKNNIYKQRQRQIAKSIKNDYNQNPNFYFDYNDKLDKIQVKVEKPKLVIRNGKLTTIYKNYGNGIPTIWDDII